MLVKVSRQTNAVALFVLRGAYIYTNVMSGYGRRMFYWPIKFLTALNVSAVTAHFIAPVTPKSPPLHFFRNVGCFFCIIRV